MLQYDQPQAWKKFDPRRKGRNSQPEQHRLQIGSDLMDELFYVSMKTFRPNTSDETQLLQIPHGIARLA
jgi:hypothetical protein